MSSQSRCLFHVRIAAWLTAVLAAFPLLTGVVIAADPTPARPNILLVMVDDMGFSDLGTFGSEIRTPHLDALAQAGLRLTNFHTTPVCAPTRAELLTGVDHHQTGIGNFPELRQDNQKDAPGYEGYLTDKVVTIAERLKAAGYATFMSGKWHLGYDPRANPAARGFDHSFVLLGGGHNHFGRDPNYSAVIPNAGTVYTEDGKKVPTPQPFYSTDYFTQRLIDFLPAKGSDEPFFGYLALTAPHYPLHASPEDIARYAGRYAAGYDVLRQQRLARQKTLGLFGQDVEAHPQTEPAPWDALTPERQQIEARLMETYAAMVDRIDQNIGRLIGALEAKGLRDNTIIVFLADNGAEGHQLDKSVIAAEQGKRLLASGDNRLESIGSAKSYVWYGPNWAEAATAPSRLYKSFPTEGGTRVPAFIWNPRTRPQRHLGELCLGARRAADTARFRRRADFDEIRWESRAGAPGPFDPGLAEGRGARPQAGGGRRERGDVRAPLRAKRAHEGGHDPAADGARSLAALRRCRGSRRGA